ncbi:MAG: cysteine desulfurase family protein [Chlamydia sp.]
MSFPSHRVYLDSHATTWIDPALIDRYSYLTQEIWGNPSSTHYEGQKARGVLLEAKKQIRTLLHIPDSYDILFFSNATEALNTLIKGVIEAKRERVLNQKIRVVSTEVEHAAVYESLRKINSNISLDYMPIGVNGFPKIEDIDSYLDEVHRMGESCSLGAFMAANNETGSITEDLPLIAQKFAERSIPLIVDGVASFGKMPFQLHRGISAFIFSGHKFHAPKGISAAIVDKKLKFRPLIIGGPQENNKRAGTENIPLIALIADAVAVAVSSLDETERGMKKLQQRFEAGLLERFPEIQINCLHSTKRIPSVSNIFFPGVDGEELLILLDMAGVSASHGSACSSGALEPSRVLLKMGLPHSTASSSLRFSWSRFTSEQDIEEGLSRIVGAIYSYRERL